MELLVALSLIAVFSSLIVLSLDNVQQSQDIESSTTNLSVYFERCRQEAIKRNDFVAMGFKISDNTESESIISVAAGVSEDSSSLMEASRLTQIIKTDSYTNVAIIDKQDLPPEIKSLATEEQLYGDYLDDIIINKSIRIGRDNFEGFLVISPGGEIIPDPSSRLYHPKVNIALKSITSSNTAILTLYSIMGEPVITIY